MRIGIQPKISHLVFYVAGGMVILLAVGAALAILSAREAQSSAEKCLQEVLALELGKTSYEDSFRLIQRYAGRAQVDEHDQPCSAKRCYFEMEFNNRWLWMLRLAPETKFRIFLGVRDGQLTAREFEYSATARGGFQIAQAQVIDRLMQPSNVSYEVHVFPDRNLRPWKKVILLTPEAPSDKRSRALSFDLSCLSKVGGCSDLSTFLPDNPN